MKKLFLICAMVAALACINVMPAQATIVLEFNPSDIEVEVCDIFFVDLVADIPESDAIVGWGLDLLYDPTQMSWDSLIIGPDWTPPDSGTTDDGLAGFLPFAFPPADPVWGNDIILATLDFHCLDVGFSTLDLAVTLGDRTEGFMKADKTFADWTSTPANITQTPEPATFFLMGTGLAGLAAARRRKKKH
jgi:PEP-CTERM motif-containing protein